MSRRQLPPLPPPEAPKPKGKKPKAKAFSTVPDIDPVDVFKAVLGDGPEEDSGGHSRDELQHYIRMMSRAQITQIERIVNRIRRQVLKSKQPQSEKQAICDEMSTLISEQIERSAQETVRLQQRISKRLDKLPVSAIERGENDRITRVCVDDKWVPVESFIRQFFKRDLERIRSLYEEGSLVRAHQRHGAVAFVKRCLDSSL